MEDLELLNAISWWALRKRRSYIRPAHYKSALHRNSFAVFWRYYSSPDEGDLKRFFRLSQTEFEMIYSLVCYMNCLLSQLGSSLVYLNTFSDKQIRATNATPSFLAKQTLSKSPISKKQKLDLEFERLMDAVENKRKMPPLAVEITELLKQVENGGNKRMQLECKRELRNFISKWMEYLLEAPERPTETLSDTVRKKSVPEMSLKEYQDLLQDC